jgi:hypothetical protein
VHNEYFEKFVDLGGLDRLDSNYLAWSLERDLAFYRARHEMVLKYAWAIPHDGALEELVKLGPIVEVGAGGGYWAGLLRARGADVIAYDCAPAGEERNVQAHRKWSEVERGPASIAKLYPDRALFLCWPPFKLPMAHIALAAYLRAGGQTLAYIGEGNGGCTADDAFFDLIETSMIEVDSHALHQWPGIRDYLTIYTRKE